MVVKPHRSNRTEDRLHVITHAWRSTVIWLPLSLKPAMHVKVQALEMADTLIVISKPVILEVNNIH